jgi:hypothetical protein
MIAGPPMMGGLPPGFSGAGPQGPPARMPAGGYVPPRLSPPQAGRGSPVAQPPAPRLVRGARGRDSERSPVATGPLAIPSPEELGIGSTENPAQNLDWSATRRQLAEMGAVRFQLENLPRGGARFSCWVGAGDSPRLIQADGSSEAEAVRSCLHRARQHVANRR